MMNLNFEEKKSSFKLLSILLLVYAGLNMLFMIGRYNTFLSWIGILSYAAMGIILLVEDVEKKYIVIPLGIVTFINAYSLMLRLSNLEYMFCGGAEIISSILRLASLSIITFYAVNLWKKIEVPFLFKYWYLPCICYVIAGVIDFIGGFLCRMFY